MSKSNGTTERDERKRGRRAGTHQATAPIESARAATTHELVERLDQLLAALPLDVRRNVLRSRLARAEADAGEHGLARVQHALAVASDLDQVEDLIEAKRNMSVLAHAESFLQRASQEDVWVVTEQDVEELPVEERRKLVGRKISRRFKFDTQYPARGRRAFFGRDAMLREVAGFFQRGMPLAGAVTVACITLRINRAEAVLGEPRFSDWAEIERMMNRQCERLDGRRDAWAYVRAVLRGWGLSESKARDATKHLELEEIARA